jgi:hypothetical protein
MSGLQTTRLYGLNLVKPPLPLRIRCSAEAYWPLRRFHGLFIAYIDCGDDVSV